MVIYECNTALTSNDMVCFEVDTHAALIQTDTKWALWNHRLFLIPCWVVFSRVSLPMIQDKSVWYSRNDVTAPGKGSRCSALSFIRSPRLTWWDPEKHSKLSKELVSDACLGYGVPEQDVERALSYDRYMALVQGGGTERKTRPM